MNFLVTNKTLEENTTHQLPFELHKETFGNYTVLNERKNGFLKQNSFLSITNGFLKDIDLPIDQPENQKKSAINHVLSQWPVSENITGTFSICILENSNSKITLCCDHIGIYPIYYLKQKNDFYISNSLILLGIISQCELDEVGIAQRGIGPEFSNFGSRTILKDCKRLLPGQYLKFNLEGEIIESKFDNTLYQDISSNNQIHNFHKEYWFAFKNDLKYCLSDYPEVNIALSGGIDSRILVGALPKNKTINCHTFGNKNNYEVKIASRLAKAIKAKFKNYFDPNLYFPSAETLKEYTLKTESVQLCSWLEILENVPEYAHTPLLLGELCEALPARNIKKFSSREFRQKNFWRYYIQNKDYQFEESTPEKFKKWKSKKSKWFALWSNEKRINELNLKTSHEEVIDGLIMDLDEIFDRIESHSLPYVELYDELFSWYTYSRMRLAKQVVMCSSKFDAMSPAMSIQNLRRTSNIHPNLRLNYRFSKKLFNEFEELKILNKIPTNQAPLIPQNSPDLIKFSVWGLRSKIDSYLIKKSMSKSKTNKDYRLFKSINWSSFYQNPDMESNILDYFKNNHLGKKYLKKQLETSIERKNLTQWPFANIDIMNACSLNVEIDLIKQYQAKVK